MKNNELEELKEKLKTAKGRNSENVRLLKEKFAKCRRKIEKLKVKIRIQKETIDEYEMKIKREATVANEKYEKNGRCSWCG